MAISRKTLLIARLPHVITLGRTLSAELPPSGSFLTTVSRGLRPEKPPVGRREAPVAKDRKFRRRGLSNVEIIETRLIRVVEERL